jgi:hypothetical protein
MGHDATPVGSGSAASRAELVAAWREHRRERRHHLTANGAPTDGFLVRKWRQAGVYGAESLALVTALLEQLLDLPEDESPALVQAADVLREALRGEPSSGVVDAVRILLEDASPAEVADALLVVHDARLLWLSPRGSRWLEFLTSCDNELLPDELMPDQHDDPSAAFALLQALRSSAVADLSKSDTERLLPWVPESIADDFITLGLVTAAQVPWRVRADDPEFRRVYWRARLVPASITREEAEALDWTAAVLRQDFLDGKQPHMEPGSVYDLLERACGGDTSVLKDLEEFLPRPLVLRLRQVTDGAATGNWEPDIVGDRALWRLMATLWAPRAAIDPHRGAFYEIRGLNHAYDLILSCFAFLRASTACVRVAR